MSSQLLLLLLLVVFPFLAELRPVGRRLTNQLPQFPAARAVAKPIGGGGGGGGNFFFFFFFFFGTKVKRAPAP
jgi:hypothetical protein